MDKINKQVGNYNIQIESNDSKMYEKVAYMSQRLFYCKGMLVSNKTQDVLISLTKNSITIVNCPLINEETVFFNNVTYTDVYPCMYLAIYSTLLAQRALMMHSVALINKDKVAVIVGTFGVGKTTLADEMQKAGWTLLTDDQTIFTVNDCFRIIGGSNVNPEYSMIEGEKSYQYYFLFPEGLSNHGDVGLKEISSDVIFRRRIIPNILWVWTSYLSSTEIMAYNNRTITELIKNSLNMIKSNKALVLRGDVHLLAQELNISLLAY